MAPTTPPLDDWNHTKGFEIAIKHKKAMRQLPLVTARVTCLPHYWFQAEDPTSGDATTSQAKGAGLRLTA
ncbi:hypothetical protein NA56DRAFT_752081 [Hyaloscypha hepaticicola]|uniref:Uncharacterized protein n=1 Tax=Hyaloscypha hepaticicola TaxID=2082293 RepID=A0A2J6PUS1_9HELO|nr:hypothetical protein NA56DRAFT_752081 [Hyaloscypha hepaticicola]